MKRLLVCLLLVGVVGCGSSPSPEPAPSQDESPVSPLANGKALPDTNTEHDKGIRSAEQNDWATAVAHFTEAIKLEPHNQLLYIKRGEAWNELGEYDKAIVDFTRAIELDPNNAQVYLKRAAAYYALDGDMMIPRHIPASYTGEPGGTSQSSRRVHDKAIADYTAAIRIKPDYTKAYVIRGYAYYNQDEFEKAIVDYTAAIRIKPDYTKAYYGRGVAHRELGNDVKAAADFAKAKELGYEPKDE